MSRAGLAVLAVAWVAAGCASTQPADEAPRLVGEWTSLDTLVQQVTVPNLETGEGAETIEIRTLRTHLAITDSTWTETSVSWNPMGVNGEGLDGWTARLPYRVAGDSVFVRYNEAFEGAGRTTVRGDTLAVVFSAPDVAPTRRRFVRSAPLGVPPEIVGFWVGLSPPDPAGVPAEVGFRFHPDGTYENGWGEARGTFRVLGPYLLLGGRDASETLGLAGDEQAMVPFEMTLEMRYDSAFDIGRGQTAPALVVTGASEADRIVLFRVDR